MADSRAENFSETSYGIVKRLQTIEAWTDRVAQRLGKPSLSILDFGCGTGDHVTYPLACLGHRVLGVDVHAASIQEASGKYRLPTLRFRRAEIDDLLKEDVRFDLIVCSEVLEHLREPQPFLEALGRLLHDRGALILTTPNGYGAFEWLTSLQKALSRVGLHEFFRQVARLLLGKQALSPAGRGADAGHVPVCSAGYLNMDSTHVQFFRIAGLEAILAQSGFRIVERRARTSFCGPYVDVLFRVLPFEQALCRMNNRLADRLPFRWAADWMFLVEPQGKSPA